MLVHADCLEYLKTLESNSVDSLVTDPPANIAFSGKSWDTFASREAFITFMQNTMTECLRVLKPGAHGLVWALPRTSHWTATAIENAGFEIRDCITHHFSQSFPKSLNVQLALEKADKPEDAKKWAGWGTALAPASEHWILCRKPLGEKTVVANLLEHETGALNINASRIKGEPVTINTLEKWSGFGQFEKPAYVSTTSNSGRFPKNVILSHDERCTEVTDALYACVPGCPVRTLDDQVGERKSGVFSGKRNKPKTQNAYGTFELKNEKSHQGSTGAVSRFFYVAKTSKRERDSGLGEYKATRELTLSEIEEIALYADK